MEKIGKNHDAYKKIKDVIKTNKYPKLTIADDIQILKIIIDKKLNIDTLLYCFDVEYKNETKKLLDELIMLSNNTYEISKSIYEGLSLKENHVGIIAAVNILNYTIKDFENKEFLFVLDRLEIPGNVGTIYRTLDSINADGVILVDSVSKIHNPKITTSSRGCNLIVPTISLSYDEAQDFLIKNGYDIYLGEPELGGDYQSYDYNKKIAIVVGNERFGINENWYNKPHKKVYIPMEGNQNSLNVGVALSILAYEAYMKRKWASKKLK